MVLKKYRNQLGYSQVELANRCEMELNEIVSLEQGLIELPLSTLITLTEQLNIPLDEFVKEIENLQTEFKRDKKTTGT